MTANVSPVSSLVADAEVAADGERLLLDLGLGLDLGIALTLPRRSRLTSASVFAGGTPVFPLAVFTRTARIAAAFHPTMRAGVAAHAVAFPLAMRAGVAVHAAAFPLAMRARVAVRAVAFQLAVRAGGCSPRTCVSACRVGRGYTSCSRVSDCRAHTASVPSARRAPARGRVAAKRKREWSRSFFPEAILATSEKSSTGNRKK